MINLTLERKYIKPEYTIGHLYIGTKWFSDTLEDPVRDYNKDGDLADEGETKIPGNTAIPFGRYKVTVTNSPKFGRKLPLIHNVWGFEGILIHAGNTVEDTSGCILVGENKDKGKVYRSRYYETKLTERLRLYIAQGHEIFLNVT